MTDILDNTRECICIKSDVLLMNGLSKFLLHFLEKLIMVVEVSVHAFDERCANHSCTIVFIAGNF